MGVTFQIMDVTVYKKDKESSDAKNINSLIPSFFVTNIRKRVISFEISCIFPVKFHLFDEKA